MEFIVFGKEVISLLAAILALITAIITYRVTRRPVKISRGHLTEVQAEKASPLRDAEVQASASTNIGQLPLKGRLVEDVQQSLKPQNVLPWWKKQAIVFFCLAALGWILNLLELPFERPISENSLKLTALYLIAMFIGIGGTLFSLERAPILQWMKTRNLGNFLSYFGVMLGIFSFTCPKEFTARGGVLLLACSMALAGGYLMIYVSKRYRAHGPW